MSTGTWPVRVGTLAECPRCRECCFAVMVRWDGALYLNRHSDGKRCRGPSSAELVDLLLTQEGLRDDGGSVSAR